MAIRDILVHVDSSRSTPGRIRAATGLAHTHGAHLTGLYVIEVPVMPWPRPPRRLLRISAQLYNRREQYDRLAEALGEELG